MEELRKVSLTSVKIQRETRRIFMSLNTSSCFYSCGDDRNMPDIVYFSERNYYGLKLNTLKEKTCRLLEIAEWIISHASRKNFNLRTDIIFDIYWLLKIANEYINKINNLESICDNLISITAKDQEFDSCYFLNKNYRGLKKFIEHNIFKKKYLNIDFKLLRPYYHEIQDGIIKRDRQLNTVDVFFKKLDTVITVNRLPISIICQSCSLTFIRQDWSCFSPEIKKLKEVILEAPEIKYLPDEVFLKLVALKIILDDCYLQNDEKNKTILNFYLMEIKKRGVIIM